MEIITRKSQIENILNPLLELDAIHLTSLANGLHTQLLQRKVRFPMLEYSAEILFEGIKVEDHINLCDKIHTFKTEGGNVILGKLLQLRLASDWQVSMAKATKYISLGDVWFISDIIGERVYGVSLLKFSGKTIRHCQEKLMHENHWVVRATGAGIHYAIKKGLDREHAFSTFEILLSKATAVNKEIRQGIGWAAKTTAKFHPDIIVSFKKRIEDPSICDNWFRKKVRMGLERNRHAQRN